ncbi:hypothetical protein GUITHDRAFT_68920, partial [Guillardia theta CCMP2712]
QVAIIGGGPAGLTMAHALLKLPTGVEQVKVFEQKNESLPGIGGGIQINGGAAVLSRLGMRAKIAESCQPLRTILSRNVDGRELLKMSIARDRAAREALMVEGDIMAYLVMRDHLQSILSDDLPDGTVIYGKKLKDMQVGDAGSLCSFQDGTSEQFDLVIGCDGIKSRVRQEIVGQETKIYSGIRIIFSVAPAEGDSSRPADVQSDVHQWFGEGSYGFAATYGGGKGKKFDQVPPCLVLHPRPPSSLLRQFAYTSTDKRGDFVRRMKDKRMPQDLVRIVENADRFFDVGVYFHNPLVTWHKGSAVLLGDAAHAMPPFLGQGANQAMQDAYCLASNLAEIGKKHASLPDALKAYERRRKPPTTRIMLNSWILGNLETQTGLGASFRDNFFTATGALGERMWEEGGEDVGRGRKGRESTGRAREEWGEERGWQERMREGE